MTNIEKSRIELTDAFLIKYRLTDAQQSDLIANNNSLGSPGSRIANGHVFQKHVVQQAEFPGVRTRSDLSNIY